MDIGSNTVRILIAEGRGATLKRVSVQRKITRLSGGFDGRLSARSMNRTLDAVREFTQNARESGITDIRAACTGVVRKASNKREFLDRLRLIDGVDSYLISSELEARLAAMGARHHLGPDTGDVLLVDIGGFSTELTVVKEAPGRSESFDIGVVSMTESVLKSDPPTEEQIAALRGIVAGALGEFFRSKTPGVLVGIAGTPTTVAAVDLKLSKYDAARVHRYEIDGRRIEELFRELISLDSARRLKEFPGLEKGREDLLPAGIVIIQEIMKMGRYERLVVSEGGLLDGLLLTPDWPPNGAIFA